MPIPLTDPFPASWGERKCQMLRCDPFSAYFSALRQNADILISRLPAGTVRTVPNQPNDIGYWPFLGRPAALSMLAGTYR